MRDVQRPHVPRYVREILRSEGVTLDEVVQHRRSRMKHWVKLRDRLYFRIRDESPFRMSFPEIGDLFGVKSHSTVIYGVRRHAREHGREMP